MRPRQNLVEIFSTFLQFDADRFSGWVSDPKLRRSMQSCLQSSRAETSEDFWSLYWYKVWQAQPDYWGVAHLSAYLQEACYWAAQKTVNSFASSQYTLSDCFQIAIAQLDKVLKGFNPQQGFSLKNYASLLFSSAIKENLRQRQAVDICTDWALLRKLSQKRLVESLQNAGLPADMVARYVLAWNCFKLLYLPTQATATQKLLRPDTATWAAIAQLYHTERRSQSAEPEVKPETLEKWLIASAKAARSYLYPTAVSINTPKPGQEPGELLDSLPDELAPDSLLNAMITEEEQQERRSQQIQLSTVLVAALAQLDAQSQELLQLYYAQSLTQQQIAAQLEMKQYTVSRRLTRARELLLLALAQWSQATLHITPTSDVLKHTSVVLEEWLQTYYSPSDSLSRLE